MMLVGLVDLVPLGLPLVPPVLSEVKEFSLVPQVWGWESEAHRVLSRQPLLRQDPYCQCPLAAPISLSEEEESQSWDEETYLS